MNLVFYSGGTSRENRSLSQEVALLLAAKSNPRVAFIPAEGSYAREDFRDFRRQLSRTGVEDFLCIPIDDTLDPAAEKELFRSDAIFLGGGNTYYFLRNVRKHGLLPKFRAFVKRGGILMGLSAGSILMTPSIMTAAVPRSESDENEVGLTDMKALGLVPFEFAPHYAPSRRGDAELLRYSKKLSHPIYACADGEGIVVRNGSIRFVGNVSVFHRGRKYTM